MASRDPAFQWESEVLRSSGHRRSTGNVTTGPGQPVSGDWLTVREASEATGVPASTIRKWARHDNIPSFLEETSNGYLRLVSMQGITRWAEEIGRDVEASDPDPPPQVDLTSVEDPDESQDRSAPEGSMIIPLDAWNRMLNQLGNLHEAGQQLAEARERAAKAETEARFLKERLADLREELEQTRAAASEAPEAKDAGDTSIGSPSPASIARKLYEGWRSKRRGTRH